jgi:hypothetical protein
MKQILPRRNAAMSKKAITIVSIVVVIIVIVIGIGIAKAAEVRDVPGVVTQPHARVARVHFVSEFVQARVHHDLTVPVFVHGVKVVSEGHVEVGNKTGLV